MGVPKTSEDTQIMNEMLNFSQEPPGSSIVLNQGFNDMDVLYTFKIKIESKNLKLGCFKDQ